MGVIIFNGVSSLDCHVQVEHPPGYETPERDYEVTHVPGRNGDILMDKGSFKNVTRTYQIAVCGSAESFAGMANQVSEWLHSVAGYARLEDSYEPEYYRIAMYEGSVEIENLFAKAGRASISFNCKPQRFLKSGEQTVRFVGKGKIFNPTRFMALPVITVKGSGRGILNVGGFTVSISDIAASITINCDIQDVYSGTQNRNSAVTFMTNRVFPKLSPGDNEISYSGGITSVEVIPNWWTL